MKKRLLFCALVLVFAGLTTTLIWAQGQGTGSIAGLVTDASGAVMPGVKVVIRSLGTNATRELITDGEGHYRADLLQPGEYQVTATQTGFATARIERLNLSVGSLFPADLKMQVAGGQQTVEVTAESAPTEPERIEVGSTVSERSVEDLPISGRRWENFVLLTPGVSPDAGFGLVSYRGISGLYNNNSIDGADNNQAFFSEARGRTRISYSISQAAVKEFQVGLSNYSAEFGRAAGGTVNAVTKSGANEFHGEGFYFLRARDFMAKNPRSNALLNLTEEQKKPPERRQQFGGSIGGPIIKDKLFFFGNVDIFKRNFPGFVIPNNFPIETTNACTAPGCASTIAFLNTLVGSFPRTALNKVFLVKMDWSLNQNNTFSGSYNLQRWDSPNGIQTGAVISVSPSANGSDGVKTDMLNLRLTSVLTSNTVNEFRFQFGRDFEFQSPNAPGPSVSYTNGPSYGMPNFLPRAAFPNEKRFQFADNYSFIRGNHSWKAGADINYVRELQINLFQGGGVYSYSSLNGLAQDCPAQATGCIPQNTGSSTGKHYSSYNQAFDFTGQAGRIFFPTTDWNFYLQDNYRFRPTVTLYFGLRYEYTQLPQPTNSNPAFPLTQSFNKDQNNFGPRFGFSWDVGGTHKTVLRGGYGIYYGRTSNSAIANGLINNGQVSASFFFTPTTAGAPVFPNVLSAPPTTPGSVTLNFFSPDYVRPLIHSADLSLEREVARGLTVSGSYLFSRAERLPTFRDINLPAPTGRVTYILPDGTAAGVFPLYLGARPNTSVGQQIISESVLNSNYNAFVVAVNKRFSRGVQFQSNFTLAKALDNGQTSTTFFGSNQPYDSYDRSINKGRSNFDIRKRWVTNFILSPSVSRFTDNSAVRAALNDWQFSGILTFSDGVPVTGSISGSLSSSIGSTNSSTTNGSGGDNRVPFIAPNAFTAPGVSNFDFRIARNFRITERAKFQVIWEGFNMFNRVIYSSLQTTQYRVVSSSKTGSNALVQLGAPTGSPFLAPLNVGNTIYGPREFQLGLKFIW